MDQIHLTKGGGGTRSPHNIYEQILLEEANEMPKNAIELKAKMDNACDNTSPNFIDKIITVSKDFVSYLLGITIGGIAFVSVAAITPFIYLYDKFFNNAVDSIISSNETIPEKYRALQNLVDDNYKLLDSMKDKPKAEKDRVLRRIQKASKEMFKLRAQGVGQELDIHTRDVHVF